MTRLEAVTTLQQIFATEVEWNGARRSWARHIRTHAARTAQSGFADEEELVQPVLFPAFARALLGFHVGTDLAAERGTHQGTPDFTPADLVTHNFVFETKGSVEGVGLAAMNGHRQQVTGYLQGPVNLVVVTNLVGLRVFERDATGRVAERADLSVNLLALTEHDPASAASLPEAARLAAFVDRFSRRTLTTAEKIVRIRGAPSWRPPLAIANADWLIARITRVVDLVRADVEATVAQALADRSRTTEDERRSILTELRQLLVRFGLSIDDAEAFSLPDFLNADLPTPEAKALRQYAAHLAYWLTTKLVLVRIWEDLGVLQPATLYDGGFDRALTRLDDHVLEVVSGAFSAAEHHYRALFLGRPAFSWYEMPQTVAVDVIYELAMTYFGSVESDVLGEVYQQVLEGIDRRLLGQYYTPRDVIRLIWDLVGTSDVLDAADTSDHALRVLDIATGSGGFLVEAASRLRHRDKAYLASASAAQRQAYAESLADGLNGIELQRFSAFVAELNLLIQFSHIFAPGPQLRIPELAIVPADTLSLHDPDQLFPDDPAIVADDFLVDITERRARAVRIRDARGSDFAFDIAIGNPPYIGEKLAAPLLRRTKERYPYWTQFSAPHPDYLYGFLIVGISKLRDGGRFGFITTEYWLRAQGAAPLRRYLAERCIIERLILFRDLRLFPDAPGQHSMVIVGRRIASVDPAVSRERPLVTRYTGPNVDGSARRRVLDEMGRGRNLPSQGVHTFPSAASPNQLGAGSWAEVIMTRREVARRQAIRGRPQLGSLAVTEGVIATPQRLRPAKEGALPGDVISALGGPRSRAGIFELTPAEVGALPRLIGRQVLSPAEELALRPVLETADVYPYAAICRNDATRYIYLRYDNLAIAPGLTDDQVLALGFPPSFPALEAHLARFRPLLEEVVRGYRARRPWWSVHRSRAEVVDQPVVPGAHWADYCVTTRWGAGERLTVGLAPQGTLPASGLHALRGPNSGQAAYLCGLFNSTPFQQLAETLPPGQIRSADLTALGIPLLAAADMAAIAGAATTAADAVRQLVAGLGARFPQLREAMRSGPDFDIAPDGPWVPVLNPRWVQLQAAPWVKSFEHHGRPTAALGASSVSETLFGLELVGVEDRHGRGARVSVVLQRGVSQGVIAALGAYAAGLAAAGSQLQDLLAAPVPIDVEDIVRVHAADIASLKAVHAVYRDARATIDALL